ncbi:multiheme c-type cytochrome [Allorhodopirellula solitaria]|uniref:Tetratricopeptide repeat protein n=1 Tax=Allorhodopirellula solitaria TaxID=2527987 RepID=A0A5C5YFW4_9BACT|nr:multiheme c-type cytochrome [Allorhodopirellula solitaria]TWT73984.1 Tetratricopeptide repeat protein [Allorhodopirellula solitaria]
MSSVPQGGAAAAVPRKKYVRAVGPRLRKLLYLIFVLVALLFANAGYLSIFTFLEWFQGETYQDFFYQYMFLAHLVLGLVLILPLILFGLVHIWNTKNRRNRRAIKIGYALFAISIAILITGILLVRIGGFDLKQPLARNTVYWLHVVCPLAAVWLYWLHRLAGPRIKWRIGMSFAGVAVAAIAVMVVLQMQDPRQWNAIGPDSGVQYFEPSLARTSSGNFIPADAMMNDEYCLKCHADIHKDWSDSVHRFSSFNNAPYLASVNATRAMSLERDGSVQASRWCAGCHDPVPFFSGAFDDPNFDMLDHPTANAGITCTVCHTITNVNSVRGNADYTIEEPLHYPFASSENAALQWINNQLVKAKPSFHKKTFLKPFHKTAEFCSTCHKVHLPKALNGYKDFLRGQNHYDPYLFSGVSGHGARSFYYPPQAVDNCNECHMPLVASDDFGAKHFDGADELSVHNHLFPSANTGIAWLRDRDDLISIHQEYLQDIVRVDIFGIREDAEIDGELTAPLRPQVPALKPGSKYLLETVIRTLKLGHLFTQGTVDSNEVWLEVKVTSGGRLIGQSGLVDADNENEVDPWSHFVNVFMLDKDGNRINRRNPEDIFTPLYNHQIPPGAGQTVHYELQIPDDVTEPVQVELKLQYRKFDTEFMDFVAEENAKLGRSIRGYEAGERYVNELPITTMAVDTIEFPIEGFEQTVDNPDREIPAWQRWNDYGIGLLLKGKAELRQAEEAFLQVEKLDRWDGPLNLARVLNTEGRLDEAVDALQRAGRFSDTEGFPRWTWAWLSGAVNAQQGRLEEAEQNLRSVLEDSAPAMQKRGFDFSLDIEVINLLGRTLFDLGNVRERQQRTEESDQYFQEAVVQFEKTLTIDPENVSAHHNLQLLYDKLGDPERAAIQQQLHLRYKPDDNAAGRAIRLAREKYPAADHAAEAVVKYSLHREKSASLETDPEIDTDRKPNDTQTITTESQEEANDVQ